MTSAVSFWVWYLQLRKCPSRRIKLFNLKINITPKISRFSSVWPVRLFRPIYNVMNEALLCLARYVPVSVKHDGTTWREFNGSRGRASCFHASIHVDPLYETTSPIVCSLVRNTESVVRHSRITEYFRFFAVWTGISPSHSSSASDRSSRDGIKDSSTCASARKGNSPYRPI